MEETTWEENIKVCLKEIWSEFVQYSIQWEEYFEKMLKLPVP
jgi:hypothetical protein